MTREPPLWNTDAGSYRPGKHLVSPRFFKAFSHTVMRCSTYRFAPSLRDDLSLSNAIHLFLSHVQARDPNNCLLVCLQI